jgi:hypothetical protein
MEMPFALTPRGNTSATRTHAPGYDLSILDHEAREKIFAYAPRIAKVDLIYPDENHSNPTSRLVGLPGGTISSVETGYDKVGDAHSQGSDDEDWLSAESVNVEYCRDRCRKQ